MLRYYYVFWSTLVIWWICRPFARQFDCNGISKNWSPNNPSVNHTPPLLQLSIELPVCWFPCPCCSVDCSVTWNLRQLVPCLIADVSLEGCFLDFRYLGFLANQTIPCIIVIAVSARKSRDENGKLEWDSSWLRCASISVLLVVTYC